MVVVVVAAAAAMEIVMVYAVYVLLGGGGFARPVPARLGSGRAVSGRAVGGPKLCVYMTDPSSAVMRPAKYSVGVGGASPPELRISSTISVTAASTMLSRALGWLPPAWRRSSANGSDGSRAPAVAEVSVGSASIESPREAMVRSLIGHRRFRLLTKVTGELELPVSGALPTAIPMPLPLGIAVLEARRDNRKSVK